MVWDGVSKSIKKGFDSEPISNKKYLKTKVKNHEEKINTNYHNDKILKEGPQCICLSAVLANSVFKIGKGYYLQVFLKNVNTLLKKKKATKYINEYLEKSSDLDKSGEE